MKPLLVGESNPYSSDPRMALFPRPKGSAGHRLATQILGMRRADYLRAFDRANLCGQRWSIVEARKRAAMIIAQRWRKSRADPLTVIILLGGEVCRAFGVKYEPFTWGGGVDDDLVIAILPHPSGRSRGWNVARAFDRARDVLRECGALPRA